MRLPEQKLYDTLATQLRPSWWIQRVENLVAAGMPDVYAASFGLALWIELKAPRAPKRDSTRLLGTQGLNPDQINWHLKARSCGIRSFVLIRDDRLRLFLVDGEHAAVVNEWSVEELTTMSLGSNWNDVKKALRNV